MMVMMMMSVIITINIDSFVSLVLLLLLSPCVVCVGQVSFEFLNAREFSLFNTSTVPFQYRFRIPQVTNSRTCELAYVVDVKGMHW